jgi:hypothetical protein
MTGSLIEFLRRVLPSDGWKCASAGQQGTRIDFHQFSQDFDALEKLLTGYDIAKRDAYIACNSFLGKVRNKKQVAWGKSHRLDIDCGPGKDYPGQVEGIQALGAFLKATSLPRPTVINSGNGLHVWWALAQDQTPEDWTRTAKTLRALCDKAGLRIDADSTTDAARVLRVPGTHNWKDPANPKPVLLIGELQPEVANDVFFNLLSLERRAPQAPVAVPSLQAAPDYVKAMGAPQIALGEQVPENPSYAAQLVEHCQTMRKICVELRGNVPEPIWYSAIGVLAHCVDGEVQAQEWSKGHPKYNASETVEKLRHAREAAGPTSCAKFKEQCGAWCAGCPHEVLNPIHLGRGIPIKLAVPPPQEMQQLPKLPGNFYWGSGGQLMQRLPAKTADDVPGKLMVSVYPIYLARIQRSEMTNENAFVFRHRLPLEGWREFSITAREFYSQNWAAALGAYGVNIHTYARKAFVSYVEEMQDALRAMQKDQLRYEQFGWKDNDTAFVLGASVYKTDGSTELCGAADELQRRATLMAPKGSLQAWATAVDELMASGGEAHRFAILAGFAAPLMHFVTPQGEGGAIVSLLSPNGGQGKTTAAYAAASIWGQLHALSMIMADTTNSQYRSISSLCHLPAVIDEVLKDDPEVAKAFVINFMSGRDKNRSQRNGEVILTERFWQTLLITTSNRSLVDYVQSSSEDAQAARIFEIPVTLASDRRVSVGDRLRLAIEQNCGHAGPAFIRYLLRPEIRDQLKDGLFKLMAYFEKLIPEPSMRFMVRLMACVAMAGQIVVNKLGLLHTSVSGVMSWAVKQLASEQKDHHKFSAVDSFVDILNTKTAHCLVVRDAFMPGRPSLMPLQLPRNGLAMRAEINTGKLYISSAMMGEWLREARKPRRVMQQELEKAGVLVSRRHLITLSGGVQELASGRTVCWEIDLNSPAIASGLASLKIQAPAGEASTETLRRVPPVANLAA